MTLTARAAIDSDVRHRARTNLSIIWGAATRQPLRPLAAALHRSGGAKSHHHYLQICLIPADGTLRRPVRVDGGCRRYGSSLGGSWWSTQRRPSALAISKRGGDRAKQARGVPAGRTITSLPSRSEPDQCFGWTRPALGASVAAAMGAATLPSTSYCLRGARKSVVQGTAYWS